MVGVQVKLAEAQSGPPTGKAFNLEVQGDDFRKMIDAVEKIKKKNQRYSRPSRPHR